MKIQKFLHSCLLVEEKETRILFDPGLYSFIEQRTSPEVFKDIRAVFITHEHIDHVNPSSLAAILRNNPQAEVFGNAGVAQTLNKVGIAVNIFEEGDKQIGTLSVTAHFAQHASILTPAPKNTAYVIDKKLLVTGDSFDEYLERLTGIEVLALPIMAPWLRAVDAVAFAEALKVKKVVPVHDGFAKDFFLERQYEGFTKRFEDLDIDFFPLTLGETAEF